MPLDSKKAIVSPTVLIFAASSSEISSLFSSEENLFCSLFLKTGYSWKWCFWMCLYPKPYFDILDKPVAKIVERVDPDYFSRNDLLNPLDVSKTVAQLTGSDVGKP